MSDPAPVRIGTRGSPMALAQAEAVRAGLAAAHPGLVLEIVTIRTTGDRVQDRPLAAIGGKGLFTKELEEALIDRRIDLAVHSMKDVPTWLPDGLTIPCVLERSDPRDALISAQARSIADLPQGAVVGTSALRRQAQLLHRRPDLRIVPLRGNAETRLRKVDEGQCDATLLGIGGLVRLGLAARAAAVLTADEMLPAPAQGNVGVEIRAGDARIAGLLEAIHHPQSAARIAAERGLLEALDGSCRTPIAALAEVVDGEVTLRGMIIRPDGTEKHETRRTGAAADAARLGRDAGEELRGRAGPGFFDPPA